ncbi:cytochrome c3 family protein [Sphingomonas sp. MMS24-J13]|uniref:cytochrome c3 family protein n=1 Tax=Sphingomonas sp. MMS24-J13 TaxID=3238686 RepID=UPI003850BD99
MAFLLRSISQSATGRDIVREHRLDSDRLSIGRDPASDIHLEDLGAALHHALIHRIAPRRIMVTAIAGLPFSIDGRSTESAEIDVETGAEIRIASFRLTISWDADAQAVAILTERFGLLARSIETRGERAAFSLAGKIPGRRIMSWAGALLVLAMFLAWPIWSFHQREGARLTPAQLTQVSHVADASWSPGPLSAAHAALARNCTACHAKAFVSVRDETCRTCHAQTHDHADPARLARALAPDDWVGRLRLTIAHSFNRPAGRCIDCHVEHQGDQAMPTPAQKFCADCHAALKAKLPDTKLPNASDFGTDHPQFTPAIMLQPGRYPRFARTSLDANPREETGLKFPHALHVSAVNGVARMAQTLGQAPNGKGLDCAACHKPDPNGGGFKPVTMEADCQSCHSLAFASNDGVPRTLRHGDPDEARAVLRDYFAAHGGTAQANLSGMARRRPGDIAASPTGANGAPQAIRALFSRGGACFDCHTIKPPSRPAGLDYGIAPVTLPTHYLTDGWFDHRAHATQNCTSCHAANVSNDASDVMQPKIAECRTCHAGEHATRAAPVASSCAMCHVYHRDPSLPASADRRRAAPGEAPPMRRMKSGS